MEQFQYLQNLVPVVRTQNLVAVVLVVAAAAAPGTSHDLDQHNTQRKQVPVSAVTAAATAAAAERSLQWQTALEHYVALVLVLLLHFRLVGILPRHHQVVLPSC